MKYRKIRISLSFAKNRLYRTLWVKDEISLPELGCVLVTALSGTNEHLFYFENELFRYLPGLFMENSSHEDDLSMNTHTMNELGETSYFIYDTEDGYEFEVKLSAQTKETEENKYACIIEGKGLGILEDCMNSLDAYLHDEITTDGEDLDNGYFFPSNVKMTKWSDFDAPLDLSEIQAKLDHVEEVIEEYRNNDIPYEEKEKDEMTGRDRIAKEIRKQLDTIPFVKQKFIELREKHSSDYAYQLIAAAYAKELYSMASMDRDFDEESYFNALKALE